MKNWFHRTVAAAVFVALAFVPPVSAGGPPPHVTFDAEGVSISGVRPGAQVAWMTYERDRPRQTSRVRSFYGIAPATPAGAARVSKQDADKARGVWFFVDTETGAFTHAVPPGSHPEPGEIAMQAAAGERHVSIKAPVARVLYVRAGRGAWTAMAHDGSPADADGVQNGVVMIALGSMTAMRGNAPPPEQAEAGDVAVAIDARWMRTGKVEVAR
jgi:hypothetical protein